MSSARNSSPYQMWLTSPRQDDMISQVCTSNNTFCLFIDWDGPIPYDHQPESVDVPATERPICDEDFEDLAELIDPLSHSNSHAIDIYLQCLSFVQSRMGL